jgi:hypothetical protein
LVLGVAILITGWSFRDRLRIEVGEGRGSGPPKPQASSTARPQSGLGGDAPWALAALPECFDQLTTDTGPRAFLLSHLPAGSVEVVPPARLQYADCTIFVRGDEAIVTRGSDRLRIPPPARFYRSSRTLSLLRTNDVGGELRIYQPVTTKHS